MLLPSLASNAPLVCRVASNGTRYISVDLPKSKHLQLFYYSALHACYWEQSRLVRTATARGLHRKEVLAKFRDMFRHFYFLHGIGGAQSVSRSRAAPPNRVGTYCETMA